MALIVLHEDYRSSAHFDSCSVNNRNSIASQQQGNRALTDYLNHPWKRFFLIISRLFVEVGYYDQIRSLSTSTRLRSSLHIAVRNRTGKLISL